MKPWISVDIETSGLDPAYHEIIEIGMVDGNNPAQYWEASLEFDPSRADAKALEVNGWGKRVFASQVKWEVAVTTLETAFRDGALLVASPAHFDVGFLEALFRKHKLVPPWGHRSVIDIKSFACARFGVFTDLKNSEIARLLDIPDPPDKHTALADAIWQAELFAALVKS